MSYCPYCGEGIKPSDLQDNQCPNCGAYLDTETLATTPPASPSQPTTTYTPPPPPPAIVPKVGRPIGVSIIAIITILEGIVFLGVGGIVALAGGVADIFWVAAVGVLVLIFGFIFLGLGSGLWNLRSWAWWLTIIFEIFGIIGTLILSLAVGPAFILTVISAIVLLYLLTVKKFFQ
jgi:hypothetical protein